jgi:hypothetical protein
VRFSCAASVTGNVYWKVFQLQCVSVVTRNALIFRLSYLYSKVTFTEGVLRFNEKPLARWCILCTPVEYFTHTLCITVYYRAAHPRSQALHGLIAVMFTKHLRLYIM